MSAPGPGKAIGAFVFLGEPDREEVAFEGAFTVLVTSIEETEGWPLTHLMAVFTMTQVVAAAAGLWVGRRLDHRGPQVVMTSGSVLGVLAVVAIALAPTFQAYVAAWAVAGFPVDHGLQSVRPHGGYCGPFRRRPRLPRGYGPSERDCPDSRRKNCGCSA